MPLNFQPNAIGDRALQVNQHAIERHLTDDHYIRGFTPGAFVLSGAAVPTFVSIPVAIAQWPAIEMPDADISRAVVSWRKPSEWRGGMLRVRYWYTSPVASTNTFMVRVSVLAVRDSEVLGGTSLVSTDTAVAGPAVLNTVIRSTYVYTTTSLGSDDELFSLRVLRLGADASDTNVNVFQLLYVEVEHIPAQQVAQ